MFRTLCTLCFVMLATLLLSGCPQPKPPCNIDSDCAAGEICFQQNCKKKEVPRKPWKPEPGERTAGQSCDPRPLSWGRDRCANGFVCAAQGILASSKTSTSSSSLDLDGA